MLRIVLKRMSRWFVIITGILFFGVFILLFCFVFRTRRSVKGMFKEILGF